MKHIFLLLGILMTCVLVQNHSFANGGPIERADPVSQLSPELQKIIDHNHNYDYPYSKNYTYPDQIYEHRKRIESDVYSNYFREPILGRVHRTAEFYKQDPQIYEMALKIGLSQKIADAEMEAVKDRINKRYHGRILLELALDRRNLEAIDLLFKYGADPFMSYAGDYKDSKPPYLSFAYKMRDTFNPGFSVDAIRLFVKYQLDPNHIMDLKMDGATFDENGMTLLAGKALVHNELAWASLMEGGGNPWIKYRLMSEPKSIVSNSVIGLNLPFLDYIIENGYLETANDEDIDELINIMMSISLRSDPYTQNRQRQLRSIVEKRGITPSKEVHDYINWVPTSNDVK